VYNLRGQKVVTLVDELKEAGDYSVNWNGTNSSGQRVSSGVYFYRMSAGDFSAMRKMVILK
jgi:flagellar hook assembly protein FlgD